MLYFFIAHAGSVLIMIAFLLWGAKAAASILPVSHAFTFSGLASAVFLLAFFGFGAKAGMCRCTAGCRALTLPHHRTLRRDVWRNGQNRYFRHPESSDGLLAQTGLPLWWGILVMAIGASPRSWACCMRWRNRISNGCCLEYRRKRRHYFAGSRCGDGRLSLHDPLLTVVGLLGALFHCSTMRCSKGCYFSARARLFRFAYPRHGKNGGTGETDAVDTAACLIGCLAISALPPLNGFSANGTPGSRCSH